MPTDFADRRRVARRIPDPAQGLSRVRLRTGRELAVIDVSPLGVLVEGTQRLLPGTHVEVHINGGRGRVLLRARVVRCLVWSLASDAVHYRGALAFAAALELAEGGYLLPEGSHEVRESRGAAYPASRSQSGSEPDERVARERVTA